jgi:hypothetical protein
MRRFTYWDNDRVKNNGFYPTGYIEYDGGLRWKPFNDQKIIDIIDPYYQIGKISGKENHAGFIMCLFDDDMTFVGCAQ